MGAGAEGSLGRAVRERADRRRAIQPQLGLVPENGARSAEIPLIIESMRLWQGMNEAVGGETGFRITGIMYLCETDADVARRETWLEYARPYQLDTQLIGAEEIARLCPQATKRFKAALYTKSDGRAEPQKAAPAIAEAARQAGAHILTDCAVRGLESRAAGCPAW